MKYNEAYLLAHVDADGKVTTERFGDDVSAAIGAYDLAAFRLASGEKVQLHRTIDTVLMSAVKAATS